MSNDKNSNPSSKANKNGGGMGGPGFQMGLVDKPKDLKGGLSKLLKYLGKYKLAVLIVFIFAIISTVFLIVGPKILGTATDTIIKGVMAMITGTGVIDLNSVGQTILLLVVLYLISAIFSFVQGYIMSGVATKISYRLRKDIYDKIHKLPFKYYDKTTNGEVLSRLTNDVDIINQSLNQSVTQIITSVATIIGILIMMLTISWQLTLIALIIVPLSLLVVAVIIKKSQKHFAKQQEYIGHVNGHVEEMYGSHVIIKSFNHEEESNKSFQKFTDELYQAAWKSTFLSGLMQPITVFIGNLGYVAVVIVGGYLASAGSITIGDIQAFIQYVKRFQQPISQVAQISNILQQTAAASERVFAFLAEEDESLDKENPLKIMKSNGDTRIESLVKIEGNVEFKNVNFSYTPEKKIIKNFSAEIKTGQKIAIVGPTGGGKSTIVKLLLRFYDLDSGNILIDGHSINDFTREDLRSIFGMVLQDTWLYSGTIADNIRYGKLDASDEEVRNAAIAAQVDHFVRSLPEGYNLILNEESSNISQGQKQLLTIARAILADPKILILDEATSSVDTRTEILIQKAMDNLTKGRTSFVIAHRLSTIKNADLILVMDQGNIIEQGTHEELIVKNSAYSKLYNSQFDVSE